MPDLKELLERVQRIRILAQDMLDTGHLFGGAIGNAMAIRDEADALSALIAQEQKESA